MLARKVGIMGKVKSLRNFWLTAYISGRETELSGGPAVNSPSGGFHQDIYVVKDGKSVNALRVTGEDQGDELVLYVVPNAQNMTVEPYSTPDGTGFKVVSKR